MIGVLVSAFPRPSIGGTTCILILSRRQLNPTTSQHNEFHLKAALSRARVLTQVQAIR